MGDLLVVHTSSPYLSPFSAVQTGMCHHVNASYRKLVAFIILGMPC